MLETELLGLYWPLKPATRSFYRKAWRVWRVWCEKVTEAEYAYHPTPATVGQRARSLGNLIYQCVDHPAWTSFEAREICVRLSVAMLQEIPGYADGVTR